MFQQHRSQHLVKCATDCCNWHIQSPSDAIRSEMSLNLLSESLIKHLVACTAQMFSKLTNNTFYFLNGILWFYQNKTKKEIKSISVLSGQICKVDWVFTYRWQEMNENYNVLWRGKQVLLQLCNIYIITFQDLQIEQEMGKDWDLHCTVEGSGWIQNVLYCCCLILLLICKMLSMFNLDKPFFFFFL